ncbi:FKBP-type peptidyl-prolyl cis-trans isomerase [Aridibaculum aurantiacum]|uniref:FKBP-type peptidyl-prolyl cis-trans isomerase n=1 Tax=Aridibaculum aurantiacum TaxID=2810307 RepID=UPI001A95F40E|nr:FKBP-type peptidyl-prolyl cis-trans isomerase [Aridibaculum aurantiacum]
MKKILAFAALAIAMASCNTSYEKTETGLAYKIIKDGKGEKLKHGQIIKINGMVKISPKDSTLFTTYGSMPVYLKIDTTQKKSHDFNEVLKFASVGDSLVTVAQVDTLVKLGLAQYNDVLKKGQQMTTTLRILKVIANEQEQVADQQKEMESFKQREIAQLEAYLKKNNIKAERTENGVFVEIKEKGQGATATAGNEISVNYTGSLVENGKKFDSNVDTTFGHTDPIKFVLGQGRVIRGWEEGLQKFAKGGKGTLYIPSLLAYGPPGQAPEIPPYAALKFEVEVLDINTNPAPQQQDPNQMSMEDLQRLMQQQQQQQQQQQGQRGN